MVEITNGVNTLVVTKGAYESMYAPQGWKRIEESASKIQDSARDRTIKEIIESEDENLAADKISEPNDGESNKSDEPELEEEEIDLSEIPLSEMSVPQLKQYGQQLGIEVDTDSAKALRSRIRKVLEE